MPLRSRALGLGLETCMGLTGSGHWVYVVLLSQLYTTEPLPAVYR